MPGTPTAPRSQRLGRASPRPWPLVGHAPAFLRDKLGFLQHCARAYGDVIELRLGGPTFLLAHPDDVRHVLIAKSQTYPKGPRTTGAEARAFFGDNILSSEGERHRAQRRWLQPPLGSRRSGALLRCVAAHTEEMLGRWPEDGIVDVSRELQQLTLRCSVEMNCGPLEESRRTEISAWVERRRSYIDRVFSSAVPGLQSFPTPARRRHRRARARLRELLSEEIARMRRAGGEESVARRLLAGCGDDLAIVDQIEALLVSSYETTSPLLTWACYLLARHPDVQERLRREIDEVIGGRPATTDDVERLPYAGRVISEVLRLYPPTWLFVRVAREADELPSGATIPAGAKVYLSQWVLHRDPRWFPEPERFDPDRFAGGGEPASFGNLPFGAGPRLCLGEGLARAEAVLVLATLVARVHLAPTTARTVAPLPRIALQPAEPIRLRVSRGQVLKVDSISQR